MNVSVSEKARRVAQGLVEQWKASTATPTPPPPPTASSAPHSEPPPRVPFDYQRARRFVRWYDGLLRVHDTAASAIADKNLGETPHPEDDRDTEDLTRVVTDAHRMLLAHPVAARQAFSALVAEGRRYAQTPEGSALHRRLQHSVRVQQASRLFRSLSMGMFGEEPSARLPTAYLDNLLRVVDTGQVESLIGRLMQRLRG